MPGTNLKVNPDFEVLQNCGLVVFEDLVKMLKKFTVNNEGKKFIGLNPQLNFELG